MKYFTERTDPNVVTLFKSGAIGVLRSDTLYGIMASALDKNAVERVFTVRGRGRNKACIVLIGDTKDLFDTPKEPLKSFAAERWPGPVSIAIESPSAPRYLQFKDGTVAYRMPADEELRELLKATGPLVAPSANMEGKPPARSIKEAEEYFGDQVDFYVDSGIVNNSTPSQLWKLNSGVMERLR